MKSLPIPQFNHYKITLLYMLITRDNFSTSSASSQLVFKAIARLLNDGTHHSQFGELESVCDEARMYTYKQSKCDKVKVVQKDFIDYRVASGIY